MTVMSRKNMAAVTVDCCMAITVTFMCGVAVTHTELSPTSTDEAVHQNWTAVQLGFSTGRSLPSPCWGQQQPGRLELNRRHCLALAVANTKTAHTAYSVCALAPHTVTPSNGQLGQGSQHPHTTFQAPTGVKARTLLRQQVCAAISSATLPPPQAALHHHQTSGKMPPSTNPTATSPTQPPTATKPEPGPKPPQKNAAKFELMLVFENEPQVGSALGTGQQHTRQALKGVSVTGK
jgi:hypothetical protein